MEIELIIGLGILAALCCLALGTIGGFALGVGARLFFRHGFREFCKLMMDESQAELDSHLQNAREQTSQLIVTANLQATEIYKAAATKALQVGIDVGSPPRDLN